MQSLQFECPHDAENSVTFALENDRTVAVSVSEERAVDSYNETFECTFRLNVQQVNALRDWLDASFPLLVTSK